ncbi:restriction endonuclease subunit S [Rhodobacter maris]|uniref:Type I restriction enzyme S subunit n=1 Tax=Rhodobacter maris TaxID=446682 RepID=A0A285RS42_9RHOB|nr:restriction endonuclease subunit S [Rhodobacter maris]SOB95222.1 type I restriction enzyme S subunit [Rhodobacter maris]
MSKGWKHCQLGDVIELKRGYDLPQKERQPGSIPLVSSSGVSDTHSVAKVKGPGVVTGRYGTIGTVYYVEDDFWPLNTTLYVRDFKGNDPRFVSYFLRGIDFHAYSDKAAVPGLNRNDLHQANILFPPFPEQRAIAATLGALDDKIELNRKMNATLEAMARALFRDWFVDFGPTRAKMEGAAPYLSPDLWSLFPDRLDAEGKPEGWEESGLLDLATLLSGGTPKTDKAEYWNGGIPWASAKDVSQCKDAFLIETERSISESGLKNSATKIIPKYATVVVARGATTGRSCMFGSDIAMNQTCYALTSRSGHPFWLNCAFRELVDRLVNAAHGSVFDTITTRTIEAVSLVQGPKEVCDQFEHMVTPMFQRLLANVQESRTLAQTRDLLLPRLMSGELRVAQATENPE